MLKDLNFEFIKNSMPELYTFAANAEQTINSDPLISLSHLKQMGQWYVKKILSNEDITTEQEDPLAHLEVLIVNDILPAHFIATLKQLEYFDTRESELLVDPSGVKRLLLNIYDLTCWYYKTYMDDNFVPSPMYLQSQNSNIKMVPIEANHTEYVNKSSIDIDGKVLEAIWEDRIENEHFIEMKNHESYRGQMLNGMKHGKGVYRWSDGTKYIGLWNRDSEHGSGEKDYSNGDRFRGEWKEGLFDGNGIYEWKDGTRYEGRWEDNLEHGFGIKTYADGSIQKGFWTYGEFVFTEDQLKEGQFSITEKENK